METAGLAGAAVVTATMGPGGAATASTGETAQGSGPMTPSATGAVTVASGRVATAEAAGASAGSRGTRPGGELGAQSVLRGRWALVTRAPALPPQVPNTPETPPPPSRAALQAAASCRERSLGAAHPTVLTTGPICSWMPLRGPQQPTLLCGPRDLGPFPGQLQATSAQKAPTHPWGERAQEGSLGPRSAHSIHWLHPLPLRRITCCLTRTPGRQ